MKLRRLLECDRPYLMHLMMSPVVRKYLGGPLSTVDAANRVDRYLSAPSDSVNVIEFQAQFAGLISLSRHCEEPATEISYQLLPQFMGQGIACLALAEALTLIDYPVVAETQAANIASRKLLSKLGFQETRFCERYGEAQVIASLGLYSAQKEGEQTAENG